MAEKRNAKNYVVYETAQFPGGGYNEGSLIDLINWLQDKLFGISREHHESTKVEFGKCDYSEGDGTSISIYYEAPETEQQMHHRLLVEHEVWGTPLLQAAPPPTEPPVQEPGPSTGPEGGTPYI